MHYVCHRSQSASLPSSPVTKFKAFSLSSVLQGGRSRWAVSWAVSWAAGSRLLYWSFNQHTSHVLKVSSSIKSDCGLTFLNSCYNWACRVSDLCLLLLQKAIKSWRRISVCTYFLFEQNLSYAQFLLRWRVSSKKNTSQPRCCLDHDTSCGLTMVNLHVDWGLNTPKIHDICCVKLRLCSFSLTCWISLRCAHFFRHRCRWCFRRVGSAGNGVLVLDRNVVFDGAD